MPYQKASRQIGRADKCFSYLYRGKRQDLDSVSLLSIMIPELGDEQRILFDPIDETVLLVYSSGPVTGESMPERFGFSFSFIGRSGDILDESIDSLENTLVRPLPIEIVFPGLSGKNDFHSIRSLSIPLPSSNSLIDSSSRRALRGLLRR